MKKTLLFLFALTSLFSLKAQVISTSSGHINPAPNFPLQVEITYTDSTTTLFSATTLNPNGYFTDTVVTSSWMEFATVSFVDCNGSNVSYTVVGTTSPATGGAEFDFGIMDYCPNTTQYCSAGFNSNQTVVIDSFGNIISTNVVMISNTSQGQNLTYTWDFGDGSPTYTGVHFLHTYANAGPYLLCLTISSPATPISAACTSTYCDSLMVDSSGVLIGKTNSGFSIQMGDGSDVSETPTSINTVEEIISALNIYPNPANDFINISYQVSKDETAIFNLYDLTGNLIQESGLKGNTENKIQLNNLDKGIYLIQIKTTKGVITRKLSIK